MNRDTLKNEIRYRTLRFNTVKGQNKRLNYKAKTNLLLITKIETELINLRLRLKEMDHNDSDYL